MNDVLLSICIPSYNQQDALRVTLDSLTKIGVKFKDQIEILVSDNGSTDDSVDISKKLLRFSEIDCRFIQRENSSLGTFCDNLAQLLRNSSGSYIWFVGCGEYVLISRLEEILQMLQTHKPSNMVLNSSTYGSPFEFSSQLERLQNLNHKVQSKNFLGPSARRSSPFDHSVSCNITAREVFLSGGLLEMGSEFRWPHIESMFSAMELGDFSAVTLPFDSILVHQPSDGWYSSGQNWSIYIELCKMYFRHSNKLSKLGSPWASTIEKLARDLVSKHSLLLIFSFKQLGASPKPRDFIELFRIYNTNSKRNSLLLVLVLVSPSFLVRIVRRFFYT
jgi:glycosyltransferase involved in cell wall biosynthesis